MDVLGIELLGGFRLTCDGRPVTTVSTNRLQELLAFLALHSGKTVSRQHLAFLFWPDSEEPQARTNLRQLLHHLKAALPGMDDYLWIDAQMIQWRADAAVESDVVKFELAASQGVLEEAARLYRGDLLPGFYEEWVDQERRRLKQKHAEVLKSLVGRLEASGDYPAAIRYAEAALAEDPLNEAPYQTLMRLHARQGDRSAALNVFEQCAALLRRDLNVEPCAATQRLREDILRIESAPPRAEEILLVGRELEWARLLDAWRRAAFGRASFAFVTGEAGIGKTRLLAELSALAAREGASIAQTSCYAAEKPMTYAPVADWLRSPRIRPQLEGLAPTQRAQLARVLPELLAEQPELNPPPPFTESWQRQHFFEALTAALRKASPPLLLVIDDLQWCDADTLEWLHFLIRSDPAARLLVGGSIRLDETGRDHPATRLLRELIREGEALEIDLGPLSEAQSAALAAQVSGTGIDSASLYDHTRGNPLFVVETARAGLTELPPKVHAVITARLAQAGGAAHEMAGLAAAFGRPFSPELLARAAGGDEESAAQSLDELWRRRILQLDGNNEYDFSHGQLREVAYREVGPARRRLLHRRIAEALVESHAAGLDPISAQVAWHYERAGLLELAIPYYERAARVVRQRFADEDAIRYLTGALNLVEGLAPGPARDQLELDLLVALGPSLSATQGYASQEAGSVYRRARVLCELRSETGRYFPVLAGSWSFHIVRGELDVGREIGSRYLSLASRQGSPLLQAAGLFGYGVCLGHLGQLQSSINNVRSSLEVHATASPRARLFDFGPDIEVFCRAYFSHLLWILGFPEESLAESARTVTLAESLSHPFSLALALAYAALLHQFRGEPDEAQERAGAAAELCRKYGFRYYLAWTPIILGWARARKGAPEEGLQQMRDGFEELRATGAELRASYYLGLIAQAYGELGRPLEGLRTLEEAFAQGQRSKESLWKAELERIRGDLLLDSGDRMEAQASYRAAVRVAREQGARSWQQRSEESLARMRQRKSFS